MAQAGRCSGVDSERRGTAGAWCPGGGPYRSRHSGAKLFSSRYAARWRRGLGLPPVTRIPYFPEHAEAALAGLTHIVLVETQPPVSFFGYPNRRSTVAPIDCAFHQLASEEEDSVAALEALANLIWARRRGNRRRKRLGPGFLPKSSCPQ